MKTYSIDLRERVVAACDAGAQTREQIAVLFSVSIRWIRDLLKRRRETGSIQAKPHGGGRRPAFDRDAEQRLREAVRSDSDATLEQLGQAAGVPCGAAVVCRTLKRMGVTRKKSRGGRPSKNART